LSRLYFNREYDLDISVFGFAAIYRGRQNTYSALFYLLIKDKDDIKARICKFDYPELLAVCLMRA